MPSQNILKTLLNVNLEQKEFGPQLFLTNVQSDKEISVFKIILTRCGFVCETKPRVTINALSDLVLR
jgi:hypothetical protein